MSLLTCFQRAAALNVISKQEAAQLSQRYTDMISDGMSNIEARDRMAKQIQAEADQRERAALMTHIALDRLMLTMANYRDAKGRVDEGAALVNILENFGHDGTFIQDAVGRQDAIVRSTLAELKDLLREAKRGAFSGDLRRTMNPKVKTRMDNIVREVWGEDTNDAKAKAIAQAWMKVAEDLRLRFNAAGGSIGKLAGGYIPQGHDRLALVEFKKGPWVEYMMEPGRLDRARMLDQSTGLPMTDTQLRRGLEVAWDRITTDGNYDADIAAPQGKGALYTQHMDHRFIHFAKAEHAIEYSRRFGNGGDVYASMMGHIQIMARDIAHMEILGPNPNRTLEFLKNHLRSKAAKLKSNEAVIEEQRIELRDLAKAMGSEDPWRLNAIDRLAAIDLEIDQIRSGNGWFWSSPNHDFMRSPRDESRILELMAEHEAISDKLKAFEAGDTANRNKAAEAEFYWLLEHKREAISLHHNKTGDMAKGWAERKIRRVEAMWDGMRGGAVGDPVWAARMQSVRNAVAAGSLGSAGISSLTDPAFGQDVRLRLGQGMKESSFARIAIANLTEMITMGKREDAIAAGFGLDSAMRVIHRHAREISGWDHRFWTAYIADRVLTMGLLLPWTQAGKHVFDLDMARWIAKLTANDWAALPETTRKAFEGHGIGQTEWARLRPIDKHEGLWLRPTEVIAADRELGERYLQMILREQRFAIPEATVRSSSIVSGAAPAGTLTGEMMRSAMQFKGFGLAVLMLHPLRIARELGAGDPKLPTAAYAATLFTTLTMLGMVAIALKDMKDGRDPRKWLDEKTWLDPIHIGEAILQAGGLGIFGDFLRASENRLGGGLAGTLAGPLAGKAENIISMIGPGQLGKLYRGKDISTEEEFVRLLRSGTVPFSNHWALSAIYQRALMDRLQRLADPEAQKAFNRTISKRRSDYGQDYWWRPGTTWPQRAPDITRPFATR